MLKIERENIKDISPEQIVSELEALKSSLGYKIIISHILEHAENIANNIMDNEKEDNKAIYSERDYQIHRYKTAIELSDIAGDMIDYYSMPDQTKEYDPY